MKTVYEELFERSKDDRAIIVGSEVREVIGEVRRLRSVIANAILDGQEQGEWSSMVGILKREVTLEQAHESWDSLAEPVTHCEECSQVKCSRGPADG